MKVKLSTILFIMVELVCLVVVLVCFVNMFGSDDKKSASKVQDGGKKYKIGVVYYDKTDTFVGELLKIFEEEINKYAKEGNKIILDLMDSEGSQRTQNEQVLELISQGCDLLLVNLVDRANPSRIIDAAVAENIPIIFFNREPVAEDLMQWDKLYYVGADAKQSGQIQGEQAYEYIVENPSIDRNGDGKIQYVILEGEAGHQDAIIRTETVLEILVDSGVPLEKISHTIANWSRAQAKNRMGQVLREYGDDVELVLSNNDDMALGAYEAFEAAGIPARKRPAVFGIDGTGVGLKGVKEGKLTATVYNDKQGQAEAMVNLSLAALQKIDMDRIRFTSGKCIYLPYSGINMDNVDSYLSENTIR